MRRQAFQMAAIAAIAAGCLAAPANADPLQSQGQFNLGLTGESIPPILQQAKNDPYAPPAGPICHALPAELDALNAALGPDADQERKKPNRAVKWMGNAVRGLIPHRDVIRFLTGAGKKDDALRQAAMAGWARRGYLKGLAKNLDCTSRTLAANDLAAPTAAIEARTIPVSDPVLTPDMAADALDLPPT